MPRLISFDPGAATGVANGYFDQNTAYELDSVELVQNGVLGFSDWMWHRAPFSEDDVVVSEKFDLNLGNEFKADLTPVQIEGILLHHTDVHWQARSEKFPKKANDQMLKDNSLWVIGRLVNWTDGRDVNDAIIHALVWLRKQRHKPTLRKYFSA